MDPGQLVGGPGQAVEDDQGVPAEQFSGGREPYAPGQALEERAARLPFQGGDAPGDGGLGVGQLGGGRGERSGPGDRVQQPQGVDVEHIPPSHGLHE
nr:hypothetical protein GCM10020093_033040 [Planobispora longispora]